MKVQKRNSTLVEFDKNSIIRAIEKAMLETKEGVDSKLSCDIANKIESIGIDIFFVENIQDFVEDMLMESNRKDVAKRYIIYREDRNKRRKNNNSNFKFITDEFVSKYKHKVAPFTNLGHFVYLRTYSRWLPEDGRREFWWETVRRAVEYNCSLVPDTTKQEAEKLYDNVFNLRQFLSGRTLYTGGTEASKKYSMSNFNCSFTIANDFEAFKDLFYLLLLGAGVGLGVKKEDVIKLPAVRGDIEVIHKAYTPVPKKDRKEYTSLMFKDNMVEILVGDSKESWCQALEYFLKLFYLNEYSKNKIIIMNYDSIRLAGEKLKTFGGYASGYKSFMEMISKIHNVLKKDNTTKKKLKTIDCLDIANIIGVSVVSGGVRRSSEVILFDFDDDEVYKSKSQLYEQIDGIWTLNEEISHRRMSNNSIQYDKKPSKEQWHKHIQEMRSSGEPAFQNLEASKKRREDAEGGNPCFSGDMNLLTAEGYKTFEELDGKEVKIVNLNGDVSNGKVWCSGEKDIVEILLCNNIIIKCTPDHILMLDNGKECKAKDSLNRELSAYYGKNPTVMSIKVLGKQKVYDFSEPSTNWGIVENVVAHNCMEIILRNRGMCNLTEVNGMGFVENGHLNFEGIYEAQRLSARAGYRMACIDFELYKWDIVNKEDMLLGCSLTGWQDMINATSMNVEDEIKLLKKLREIAHNSANELADKLGKNRPKLYTTVKPSGTISQLPTVSSGIHFSHSPYYIRRVRINAHDPLVDVLKELEYPVLPEVGQTWEKCDTVVVEFPVKSPEGKTKYDVSAIEQLEIYKKFMKHYCDHNVSITVHVRNDEWDKVEDWVWDNWDDVIAVSFLSLDDNFYQLMPYEEINKEEYEKRMSLMSPFIASLINKYEKVEAELDIGNDECSSGSCPIR